MNIGSSTFNSLSGVSVKSFREVRAALVSAFEEVFSGINTEASSPDGMLIDLLSYIYVEIAQSLQGALANIDVDTAYGVYLDSLSKIAGITRESGESDVSLRSRMKEASFTGMATYNNMLTYLRNCISASVNMSEDLDNRRFSVFIPNDFSVSNIDPKDADWQKILADGREANVANYVAQKIWNCKPAGVLSLGNKGVGSAIDVAGNYHEVLFNYSEFVDFDVRITITEYSEELLPDDYKKTIKNSVAEWALDEYTAGKDVIPKRICVPVYKSVSGIDDVVIEVKKSGTSTWSTTRIPVDFGDCARIPAENVEVVL